jgi:multisubunit Na+/H+ antiporter MnhB subunit
MSNSTKSEVYICLDCGAEIKPWTTKCWCCWRTFSPNEVLAISEEERRKFDKTADAEVKKASAPLMIAAGIVLTSIFLLAPGIGILLMILAAPAMIRILSKSDGSNRTGERSTAQKVVLTILAIAGLGVILISCLIVAFFVSCLAALNMGKPDNGAFESILIFGTLGGGIVLATVFSLVYWKLLIKR